MGVAGAKHLWVGHAERVLDDVVGRVVPTASPLPRTWSGPMQTADSSMYADRTTAVFGTDPQTPSIRTSTERDAPEE